MNNDLSTRNRRNFPPIYDPGQQYSEERSLYPMGQYLQTPSSVKPEAISQYDPAASKKIFGMPVDRFASLLGTLSATIAPKSAQGRFGAGIVSMADMMREERMGQARAQATAAETRRKAAAQTAKEKREVTTKKKGKAPTVRTFRVGNMDVQHSFNYDTRKWEPIPGMKGKPTKETEKERKPPTIRTFRVGDMDVQHAWDVDTGGWKPIPGMPGKKITPPAGEKPPTYAEKRARAKAAKESEGIILNPAYQTAEYQNELQMEIDNFERFSDKPYTYRMIPGRVVDWGRDVPPKLEKVDISTPEKIMDSNLPDDMKRRLLLKRFSSKFE